jgi:hypothetical protein
MVSEQIRCRKVLVDRTGKTLDSWSLEHEESSDQNHKAALTYSLGQRNGHNLKRRVGEPRRSDSTV